MARLRRLLNTLRAGRVQRDIDRELSFHLSERIDQLQADGLSPEEARRHARLQFGNPIVQRERTFEVDIAHALDAFTRNLRDAIRVLIRVPAFTAMVVLTLALGIGANSAVFAVLDAALLRPLPFRDAAQLTRLRQLRGTETTVSPDRLEDWNRLTATFAMISGFYVEDVSDTTREFPERLRRGVVAPRFLEVLGVTPLLGRSLFIDDHRSGGPSAVLISHRYWRERLDASPDVLARTVRIAERSYPIAGVMPEDFSFPDRDVDLWWPSPIDGPELADDKGRQLQWYTGIGRLKPGTTAEQAGADLAIIQAELARRYPQTDGDISVRVSPLADAMAPAATRGSVWLLFGSVCVLLLIACTNIAALLLSRTVRRRHEIAVRFSLGAARSQIALQLLTETAILVVAGTVIGVMLAAAIASDVQNSLAPFLRLRSIAIDGRVLMYTTASAAVVALLCGLLPAIRGSRGLSPLPSGGRSHVSGQHTAQWMLVGIQVTLTVTLLFGAGLLLRSVRAVSQVDPGFDSTRILAFRVSGNWNEHYANPAGLLQRISLLLDHLATVPGVDAAGTSWTLPGARGPYQTEFALQEGASVTGTPLMAAWRTVSPGYFPTMEIPLVFGERCRALLAGIHRPGSTLDLMVNRLFAERYFPGRSPVGARLTWEQASLSGRIAGVVGNARELGLDHEAVPTVYACDNAPNPFPWFVVRTAEDPAALAATVRQRLRQAEPLRFVYDIAPLDQRIGDSYAQNRLRMWLLSLFALTALGLACAGIYGTLSYAVGLRRREVALRLALGAARRDVVQHLIGDSIRIVGFGSAAGLALALLFARTLTTMLYGVSPADPATLAGVIGLVLIVACMAAVIPAARATFGQPMRVLREE